MATTSLSLGSHWEKFVKEQIASGRFASASEVVRAALRELEEKGERLKALQDHLAEGALQAKRGEYVEFSAADVLTRAKLRAGKADQT
jgi:antitoxin ParD1/3/4